MQLLENSLYSTPAERDALIKDKKRVMDALCFSLLGFLGCYQLAQTRGALRTYQQTEGKLQLNSIGDTNHDVSLSVKLADEAHCIPTPAAQNVTKLLYKIKSKQIKGPLNEQLVRDIIKQLKIMTNRPDTMVFNVVSQFEDGSIGLGELASKLYNLSKLPNFKGVSGEFRALVMKGQYQELFAKLPKPGAATPVTNVAAPKAAAPAPATVAKAVAPAPAPVVTAPPAFFNENCFGNVPDSVLDPFLSSLLTSDSWTPSVVRDKTISFCKKNKIENRIADPSQIAYYVAKALGVWMEEKWNNKDFNYLGDVKVTPRWFSNLNSKAPIYIPLRLLWLYCYKRARDKLLLEGRYEEFNEAMKGITRLASGADAKFNFTATDKSVGFLNEVISPKNYWSAMSKMGKSVNQALEQIALYIGYAAADTSRNSPWPWTQYTPENWSIANLSSQSWMYATAKAIFCSAYENTKPEATFAKAFKADSSIGIKQASGGAGWVVTGTQDYFDRQGGDVGLAMKTLVRFGVVKLVDLADDFGTMTRTALSTAKKAENTNFFYGLAETAKDSFGKPDVILSEKFTDWLVDQMIHGDISVTNVMANSSYLPDPTYGNGAAAKLAWNVYLGYTDKVKELPCRMWMMIYNWNGRGNSLDPIDKDWQEETKKVFYKFCHDWSSADIASIAEYNGVGVSQQKKVYDVFVEAIKAGKWKMPTLPGKTWYSISQWADSNPDTIETLLSQMDQDTAKAVWSNSMTAGWRPYMIRMFSELRDFNLQKWYTYFKAQQRSGTEVFRAFLKEYYGARLDEDMVKPMFREYVMECIKDVANTPRATYQSFLEYNQRRLPAWIDKPLREAITEQGKKYLNLSTVQNASHLMDKAGFNDYVKQGTIQEFGAKVSVNGYSDAAAISGILEKIAKNPEDYKVDTLLRLAYAMHKSVKDKNDIPKDTAAACYESLCEGLANLLELGYRSDVDAVYDALSFAPELRQKILDWFRRASLLRNAIGAVKNDQIHALVDIDQKRMNQLMKFNNITFPTIRKTPSNKLSDVIKQSGSFDLEPLRVTQEDLDEKAMMRRTAEFDAFNRYRHGNIGVKFIKSFNVAIPSQIAANDAWNAAHPTSERMDPVFHGTGSVAATFVLRYGFAVISASDSSVVGRMLGNGIYFSNVLDKCGQYIGDGGYSRGIGTKGYIFQMRANLGQRDTDYKSQSANLVSPEWCVFHPNDQLNIYKAHFVELVDKKHIDAIKENARLNENFFQVEQFKEYLKEDLQKPTGKGCVSYTFIDGTIPVSDSMAVDFEDFDPTAYGPHVTLDVSGLGPVVYIEIDDPDVNDIFAIRYTVQFMSQADDFQRFQNLLSRREVK